MTRRPPWVGAVPGTSAASDHACSHHVLAPCKPRLNCPSEMGDRRVGTCLPCEDRPVRTKTTAHQSLTRTHDRRLGLSLTHLYASRGHLERPRFTQLVAYISELGLLHRGWRQRQLSTAGLREKRCPQISPVPARPGIAYANFPTWIPALGVTPQSSSVRPTPTCSTTPSRWWLQQAWRQM